MSKATDTTGNLTKNKEEMAARAPQAAINGHLASAASAMQPSLRRGEGGVWQHSASRMGSNGERARPRLGGKDDTTHGSTVREYKRDQFIPARVKASKSEYGLQWEVCRGPGYQSVAERPIDEKLSNIQGAQVLISTECGGKGGDSPLVHGVNHPNIRDVGVESGEGNKVSVGHECPRSNHSDAGSIHNPLQPDSNPMQPVNLGDPVPSCQGAYVN
ncbi:hypothetical protein K438DRAFT_1778565 [Mycena galopus ATCC 62051]|nr:hypothetical protein K438DRAFT_1778565 [Mycena galopus ATCC 62051]